MVGIHLMQPMDLLMLSSSWKHQENNYDLSEINGNNSLLGERWLEFWDLINMMISVQEKSRADKKTLKDYKGDGHRPQRR